MHQVKFSFIVMLVLLMPVFMPAQAEDEATSMRQQMAADTQRTCTDKAFLACTGLSQKACFAGVKQALQDCEAHFPVPARDKAGNNRFFAYAACLDKQIPHHFGITQQKLNECDPETGTGANR